MVVDCNLLKIENCSENRGVEFGPRLQNLVLQSTINILFNSTPFQTSLYQSQHSWYMKWSFKQTSL